MLEFLIDNIFVMFGGYVFQQIVGISLRTNCVPFFLYIFCFEADFMQRLLKKPRKKIVRYLNLAVSCVDDFLLLR
jgi:hypothetical protein